MMSCEDDVSLHHLNQAFVREGSEYLSEEELRPEDTIPDLPENQAARNFLKNAPTKGLHMPLGKEVKVMQCWRCKAFGHRTGDRECPLRISGNLALDEKRRFDEDPMNHIVQNHHKLVTADAREIRRQEKYARVEELKKLVEEIRAKEAERKLRKREKKERRKKNKKSHKKYRKSSK